MNKRSVQNHDLTPRLVDTTELMQYSGLGRNRAIEFGDAAGARVQVGRRVLWDRTKIDKYIDEATGIAEGRSTWPTGLN